MSEPRPTASGGSVASVFPPNCASSNKSPRGARRAAAAPGFGDAIGYPSDIENPHSDAATVDNPTDSDRNSTDGRFR
jgi:hypothetical protein